MCPPKTPQIQQVETPVYASQLYEKTPESDCAKLKSNRENNTKDNANRRGVRQLRTDLALSTPDKKSGLGIPT